MLPRPKRLSTALFKGVIGEGRSLHSPLFVIRVLKLSGPSRFSVSVPKKIAKTAVLRNKIRRRIYSALEPLFPNIKADIHGVFIVKPTILTASFEEISKGIKDFFGKSGFLK